MLDHDHITGLRYASPILKGPPTDFVAHVRNLQFLKECAQYELQYVDCMEAYGGHRGQKQCRLILEDMYECAMRNKRIRRIEMMHQERRRQYKNGEKEKLWAETPPLDLF
ncbi:NADH dehydrogenase [ubiquinone] iron-sulfur protein 5 [Nylanderia fulva]|uniref:NADH dehydrogenase [ubiquinone] iron-sulfur protein 5 n=1 Tax=Nylanderia fulva TaxID=613905 RepID=UPI0010FAF489|nr:NADH dehydrogenase [ubiquinone] iron-sulfur protein 5 [Nylanderia fulva]XP_029170470.1 NADH dehydrogenase [ubiquinone] iron-sulfur protein 5 [Nylanderia fulva]XP_029170471.1 NADH dehydrogenase [ubiquinone] iron-sulfur protein 5 [Nylanderia fulva]XP_029170472.1 NADH dehydrogenase [ubiquinone] iron-sulfur protein 5 [Nylanderia fulva]